MLHFTMPVRMTCPAPDLLIPHVFGNGNPAIARHVDECVACRGEVARLREVAGGLRASALLQPHIEGPDCLDELAVADFVDGRLSTEARVPVVAHLLACSRCRMIVAAAGNVLGDAEVAAALPSARPAARPRRWFLPVGAAAAAALLLAILPRTANDPDSLPVLREPAVTTTVAPMPIAPRGPTDLADKLVWTSVPRAERYRLLLYTGDGALLWTLDTSDTLAVLPGSIALTPGTVYLWKVEAQTEWKRWAASDLVEFRIRQRSR